MDLGFPNTSFTALHLIFTECKTTVPLLLSYAVMHLRPFTSYFIKLQDISSNSNGGTTTWQAVLLYIMTFYLFLRKEICIASLVVRISSLWIVRICFHSIGVDFQGEWTQTALLLSDSQYIREMGNNIEKTKRAMARSTTSANESIRVRLTGMLYTRAGQITDIMTTF